MESEKKRAKKEGGGHGKDVLGGGDKAATGPTCSEDPVVVLAGLQDLPKTILKRLISYVGSYLEDCKSLVALRATSRLLRNLSEQELEASVLKRKDPFNRYDDWMFSEDYGTPLRKPSIGLQWSYQYSICDNLVKKALESANFHNNSLEGSNLSNDVVEAASDELRSGAEQIQIGDFRSQGRDLTCGCNWCSRSSTQIDRADWAYGWRIRVTCQLISAERAREIIGEICELQPRHKKQRYLESHVERRERPQLFVAEPNNALRRQKYSISRRSSVLLAVADESSITHACISIKGHKGCKLAIRTEDIIFFRTQTSKQQVAFYYHDEHLGRSAFYSEQF